MRKSLFILLLPIGFIISANKVQLPAIEKINWLTIEELNSLQEKSPKPIIIDLYTNWCHWCKVMDKKTYQNQDVVKYVNDNYYALKMNAETRDIIKWGNKTYSFNSKNKINDFSLYLTNGQLSFPTTVIFPQIGEAPVAIAGFMEPAEIESILKYFAESKYKTQNFNEFYKTFKRTW